MAAWSKSIWASRPARARPPRRISPIGLTIAELVHEWLDHCKLHYMGTANTASNEYDNCRYAARPLVALFGGVQAVQFTTDDFREVREAMTTAAWKSDAAKRKPRPWSRTMTNGAVNRIKRLFRWAVEHNRVPADSAAALLLLSPLEKGRSIAKETDPKGPVDSLWVDATLPHLSPIIRAMVELQRATGLRSDNVTALRPMDLDRSGDVWIYCPPRHKGTAKEKTLAVAIGPRGQAILKPYLERPANAYCFSPPRSPEVEQAAQGPLHDGELSKRRVLRNRQGEQSQKTGGGRDSPLGAAPAPA